MIGDQGHALTLGEAEAEQLAGEHPRLLAQLAVGQAIVDAAAAVEEVAAGVPLRGVVQRLRQRGEVGRPERLRVSGGCG